MSHRDTRREQHDDDEIFYLEPGFIYVGSEKSAVKTVLGNCVSVCLWDTKLRFGGMNHFVYPYTKDKHKATARFGNIATKTLIKNMIAVGSVSGDLVAQIVGGASKEDRSRDNLGRENVAVARQVLDRANITIKSEDIGGHLGRKVIFDVQNGQLMVIKVHQIRDTDWIKPSLDEQKDESEKV
ncbi:MAG: chemotaxis protein CheD [Fidelibacterota bacterium]